MPDTTLEQPIVNIVGERVALGPARRDLLPILTRWINDFSTLRTIGAVTLGPTSAEAEERWYDAATGPNASPYFLIYERATGRPIGGTGLRDVDHRNRTAIFGILIGEVDARGQGYGTEATRLMLDYAFTALGLHSVLLTVAEYNHAGRRAYAKAGFRECGRRRQCRLLAGKLYDDIYMDCLATEFSSPVLGTILAPDELHITSER
ncbi:MAG: GNAT family N-acetyltransferase [Chloroflexota bacterium]|nr:GNAT family N-acetyltransferase [Chloroflexota bacterium]